MRADSGSMLPPVTGTRHSFQMTPHSTCRAEWVRIERVPPVPVDLAGHLGTDLGRVTVEGVPDQVALLAHLRRRRARPGVPVSWGWPPPVG